jgi:hypothetical protein
VSKRRTVHDRLFRAVVVMGAAMGTSACTEHGKSPPADARVADAKPAPVDAAPGDVPVDTILIL